MSRYIEPKASVTITEEEEKIRRTDLAKLLFTSYRGRDCALYLENGRLVEAAFFPKESSKVGSVYIGRISNINKNIDACFVEITRKELCFLSLKDITPFCLLNRKSEGKVVAGDELLVQITRDASKTKQAVVSARLTFENEYFVLSMGNSKVSYSSKLSQKSKERIRQLLDEAGLIEEGCMVQSWHTLYSAEEYHELCADSLFPEKYPFPEMGFIVRTKAGELESKEDLLEYFHSVSTQMAQLLRAARHRSCFTCLKKAPSSQEIMMKQFLSEQDTSKEENSSKEKKHSTAEDSSKMENTSKTEEWEIITDQKPFYDRMLESFPQKNLDHCPIRLYQDSMLSLSALYSVESKLDAALNNRVWLKSGAYLVIEATEALTVIDVNSGKSSSNIKPSCEGDISAWNPERAACLEVNMEAAREVAAQLRLRNLSGIIIVDFISMKAREDNTKLLEYLRKLVKLDRIITTVVDMTPLGLVEITRKKINKPLKEQYQKYFANS